jgi:alpha-galactosidase
MRKTTTWAIVAVLTLSAWTVAETVPLSSLDLTQMSAGWGRPLADKAVTGKPMTIGKQSFKEGVGTHAESELWIQLDGKAEQFAAKVGVDGAAGSDQASIEFIVLGDGKELYNSGLCKLGEEPRICDVALKGVKLLVLTVTGGDNGMAYDHANWAEAKITYAGEKPQAIPAPVYKEEPVILTPPPPATPKLNNPKVYGVRPGSPFLFRIPATGKRPMTFAAEGLPPGLKLDATTGIITGAVAEEGEYKATLVANNGEGEARRPFKIVAGKRLALTPPMGWNSWYIHYHRVTEQHIRGAADQMIASGMADHGYEYVNIDDCWMKKQGDPPYRDAGGAVLPNAKFPDMKGMADYIHGKGLKAGLYTSPGPWTCAGYVGAYRHEAVDARKFAE